MTALQEQVELKQQEVEQLQAALESAMQEASEGLKQQLTFQSTPLYVVSAFLTNSGLRVRYSTSG